MNTYHYTESGLDNVYIENADMPVDDKGRQVHVIENIAGLHKVISFCIVNRPGPMSGAELRFLRTEMGLTQSQLAEQLKKEMLTVGRWERNEVSIDSNAELVIRLLAFEKLNLEGNAPVITELMNRRFSEEERPIMNNGEDPTHYKPSLRVA